MLLKQNILKYVEINHNYWHKCTQLIKRKYRIRIIAIFNTLINCYTGICNGSEMYYTSIIGSKKLKIV